MHNHAGADQCVCPDQKENTQNRANTQVRPYRKNKSMKYKANRMNESATTVSYVGAGLKPAPTTKRADLPDGWRWKTIGEICNTTSGGTPSRATKEYFKGNIPWVKSGELPDGLIIETEEYITEEAVKNSSAKIFPSGTLLIAMYGATVGKLGIINREAATNQAVCAIFPHKELDTKYLFWYLKSLRADLISKSLGGAQPNISQGILRNIPFPLAPLDQQKLIVAEIEKQFSRLDEAVAALKRIQANLKRYKASVLKAAVEGKLTEEWRSRRRVLQYAPTKDETGADLLKRILTERRKKWEEDYVNKYVGAHGHAPKDDSWKKKYKEPAAPDTSKLPDLPMGWVWSTTDQLSWYITSGSRDWKKYYSNKGVLFIRTQDINKNKLELANVAYVDLPDTAEGKRSLVECEDMLVIITGANVGKVALVDKDLPEAYVSQSVGLMKLSYKNIAKYLHFAMIAEGAGKTQLEKMVYGMGRPVLNLENLHELQIPLPPHNEQLQIVAEVEQHLSIVNEIEYSLGDNLSRAERLRQSILKKAFSGKLV
ncbi:MAG: restriction endonuclease subunit S [Thermodesulfovibrionales bacterium]|jgi:type I restriction enzyme S subunit